MATLTNDVTQSQNKAILKHLSEGKTITPGEARILYGCDRLGARVFDLKQRGFEIETKLIKVEKANGKFARIGQYKLIKNAA